MVSGVPLENRIRKSLYLVLRVTEAYTKRVIFFTLTYYGPRLDVRRLRETRKSCL